MAGKNGIVLPTLYHHISCFPHLPTTKMFFFTYRCTLSTGLEDDFEVFARFSWENRDHLWPTWDRKMPPTALEHRRGTWMKMDDNGRFDSLTFKKMVAVLSYARKLLKVLELCGLVWDLRLWHNGCKKNKQQRKESMSHQSLGVL